MTNAHRRRFLKLSGAAGATALTGLAGCNGGGGTDTSSSSTSTSTSGGSSEPITIAATVPLTGQFASVGEDLKHGYELGAQRMNDAGVLDREVELILQDDESDAQTVRDQLNKMLSNNDVDMIWSTFADLLIGSQIQIAEQKQIPLIAIAQSNSKLHTDNDTKWLFSPFPQTDDHVASTKAVLDGIPESERPNTVAIWEANEAWSVAMGDAWESALSGDYDVVLHEKHSVAAKDFSTLIEKTKSAGAEALLGSPTPVGGITAMKQIRDADYTPKFLEFVRAADTRSWHTALGDVGRHVCMSPGWVPGLTGNGNEELTQNYVDQYDVPEGQTLPVMVGASYNATQVAQQALEAAGTTDKADVQSALRNGTFQTVVSEFGFDDVGIPTNFTAPMGQWIDANQHLVYPETDGEEYRDLVYPFSG